MFEKLSQNQYLFLHAFVKNIFEKEQYYIFWWDEHFFPLKGVRNLFFSFFSIKKKDRIFLWEKKNSKLIRILWLIFLSLK